MKKISFPTVSTAIILLAAAFGLVRFPKEISQAVTDGLRTCTQLLLPNLFPFFVLSSMVMKLGLAQALGKVLEPLMQPLFQLPGACSCALVLGFLGGYPTGAKTAAALYQEGLCSKQQAQRLLAFCNNCGPAFLLGAVGYGIFGQLQYGLLLTGVHISAAFLTGVILNRCAPDPRTCCGRPLSPRSTPLAIAFVDSVTESMQALLNLFAFVLCFCAVTQLCMLSQLPDTLSKFFLPFLSPENSKSFLLGLLEMTSGVTQINAGGIQERLILSSALLGWGGLSVHCQVLSLLRGTDLSPALYFKGKALHAGLSAVLMAATLWNLNGLCLLAGGALIFLPCTAAKKSSGKSVKGIV